MKWVADSGQTYTEKRRDPDGTLLLEPEYATSGPVTQTEDWLRERGFQPQPEGADAIKSIRETLGEQADAAAFMRWCGHALRELGYEVDEGAEPSPGAKLWAVEVPYRMVFFDRMDLIVSALLEGARQLDDGEAWLGLKTRDDFAVGVLWVDLFVV